MNPEGVRYGQLEVNKPRPRSRSVFFFFYLLPKLSGTCVMRIERIESAPVNPSHISGDAPLREEEGGGGGGLSSVAGGPRWP
jgi:hypothetical protein